MYNSGMPSDIPADTPLYDEIKSHYELEATIYYEKNYHQRLRVIQGDLIIKAQKYFGGRQLFAEYDAWCELVFPHLDKEQLFQRERAKFDSIPGVRSRSSLVDNFDGDTHG